MARDKPARSGLIALAVLGRKLVEPIPLLVVMTMQLCFVLSIECFLVVFRRFFYSVAGQVDEDF